MKRRKKKKSFDWEKLEWYPRWYIRVDLSAGLNRWRFGIYIYDWCHGFEVSLGPLCVDVEIIQES